MTHSDAGRKKPNITLIMAQGTALYPPNGPTAVPPEHPGHQAPTTAWLLNFRDIDKAWSITTKLREASEKSKITDLDLICLGLVDPNRMSLSTSPRTALGKPIPGAFEKAMGDYHLRQVGYKYFNAF